MNPDDTDQHRVDDSQSDGDDGTDTTDVDSVPNEDDRDFRTSAIDSVDQRIVELLSWILDTETRAKIYAHLLASPASTSEEIAKGTGLYPSTVREALAELHEEGRVTREKRESDGAGNNPYEYTAIQPSELVGGAVDQIQQELNTLFTLDRVIGRESTPSEDDLNTEPVTITVDDAPDDTATDRPDAIDDNATDRSESTDETTIEVVDPDEKSTEQSDAEPTDTDSEATDADPESDET